MRTEFLKSVVRSIASRLKMSVLSHSTMNGPPKLEEAAMYLIENVLADAIIGERAMLPQVAPGFDPPAQFFDVIIPKLRARIFNSSRSSASISKDWVITLTTSWFCKRWCSSYLLLKSITHPQPGDPFLKALEFKESFEWPTVAPSPALTDDETVDRTNKVYPCIFAGTLLHEIGHAIYAESGLEGPRLEYACDHFAISYLLGNRSDADRGFVMLGLAVWLCCLCSESLDAGSYHSVTHPNPVARVESFLKEFVPADDEFGGMAWMICVSHVIRLARIHNRGALDEEVLPSRHADLAALLSDLKCCW